MNISSKHITYFKSCTVIFGAKNKSLMKNDLKSGIIISPNLLPFSSQLTRSALSLYAII